MSSAELVVQPPQLPTHGTAAFDLIWNLGVTIDLNGLELRPEAPPLTLSGWMQIGAALFAVYDSMQFVVGDWVNWGEAMFGEDAAQAIDSPLDRTQVAARITSRDPQTIVNWASTARKVAKGRRRMRPREDDPQRRRLSYEHHYAVAKCEPDDQTMWLERAIESGWTYRQLRDAMLGRETNDRESSNGDDPDAGAGGGDGLTIAQRIEQAARRVFHQGQPTGEGGALVPAEPWKQLAASLGEGE